MLALLGSVTNAFLLLILPSGKTSGVRAALYKAVEHSLIQNRQADKAGQNLIKVSELPILARLVSKEHLAFDHVHKTLREH